jgi:hypothetical protein
MLMSQRKQMLSPLPRSVKNKQTKIKIFHGRIAIGRYTCSKAKSLSLSECGLIKHTQWPGSFLMMQLVLHPAICKINTTKRFLPRSWGQSDVTIIVSVCIPCPRQAIALNKKNIGKATGPFVLCSGDTRQL